MTNQPTAQCQYCARPITADAEVCPGCHSRLKPLYQVPRPSPPAVSESEASRQPSAVPVVGQDNLIAVDPLARSSATAAPANAADLPSTSRNVVTMAAVMMVLIFGLALIAMQLMAPLLSKAKEAAVSANMQRVKQAADSYYASSGRFPISADDFKASFSQSPLRNPFSAAGSSNSDISAILIVGTARDLSAVSSEPCTLHAGQIEYDPIIKDGKINSYAIRGAGANEQFVKQSDGNTLILAR